MDRLIKSPFHSHMLLYVHFRLNIASASRRDHTNLVPPCYLGSHSIGYYRHDYTYSSEPLQPAALTQFFHSELAVGQVPLPSSPPLLFPSKYAHSPYTRYPLRASGA